MSGDTWKNSYTSNFLEKEEPWVCPQGRYWIASPNAEGNQILFSMDTQNGTLWTASYHTIGWHNAFAGLRPMIRLKSNVHLVEKTNGTTTTYELELD